MFKLEKLLENRIVANLVIWVFLFLILLVTVQADNRLNSAIFIVLMLAPAVYINNLLILPYFRKKKALFLVLFTVNTIFFSTVFVLILFWVEDLDFKWPALLNFIGVMTLALSFGTAIKLARDSFTRRQKDKEAELQLLKAQLNPHFLFNTLNNLYGLSVIKSDKLPDLMLKLSDLLRYSLYDTKESLVPLEKEILYLENYISLEKIRLESTTTIQFSKTGNFSSIKIAPMLLIVFVENAFKHLGSIKDSKRRVEVSLKIEANSLSFKCANTIDENLENNNNLEKGKSGIGLLNAKKRLELMYPEQYELQINETDNNYVVELKLNL